MSDKIQKNIIIVGAGPGGLTAAMLLAHRGCKVSIYEKESVVGGRNAPLKVGPYTFDTGPTFLMMEFILAQIFSETGRNIHDYLKITKLDPMYRLVYKDAEILMNSNHAKMAAELERVFPGSGKPFKKFLKKEKNRFEKLFPCLQKPYSSLLDFVDSKLIKALPYLSPGRSMFSELGKYFPQDDLRLAFTFQSKYIGMSAWECPALFNLIPYVEHGFGIYHTEGGLNAISLAMEKVCGEQGVAMHKNTPVRSLIRDGRKVKGVYLQDGSAVYGDEIIVNADFGYAAENLMGPLRKYTKKKLSGMNYSCSIFMLYFGLDRVLDIPHHNIYFARDYRKNVQDIFKNKTLSTDTSFYLQNASITDPTLAPKGHSTLYVLVPVTNNRAGINWEKEKHRFKELVLDTIQDRTGIKNIRSSIRAEYINTPDDWEKKYNVYTGGVFNIGHNLSQMLYRRPHNKFEELENCYLTGGGTHPGSGLPTIYESARISANMLCKKNGIDFPVPPPLPEE